VQCNDAREALLLQNDDVPLLLREQRRDARGNDDDEDIAF
jgi:hypothetical protein